MKIPAKQRKIRRRRQRGTFFAWSENTEFLSFERGKCFAVVIGVKKYTTFQTHRTRISNRTARQKYPAHKANYPICGLRGVLQFCCSTARSHQTVIIGVRGSSRCRRSATTWLRVIEMSGYKRRSLPRALLLNS
jgi:hypothetical protein